MVSERAAESLSNGNDNGNKHGDISTDAQDNEQRTDAIDGGSSAASNENNGEEIMGGSAGNNDNNKMDDEQRKQNMLYRERLVELSLFLTYNHSYYAWNDEDESEFSGVFTPEDIESALRYRLLLHMKEQLLDVKCSQDADQLVAQLTKDNDGFVSDADDDEDPMDEVVEIDDDKRRQLEDALLDIQEKISACSKRDQQLHQLLQRFEVWSTKALAHDLLMPPCGCQDQELASEANACWSKLLHIPGAAHFADRWPQPLVGGDVHEGNHFISQRRKWLGRLYDQNSTAESDKENVRDNAVASQTQQRGDREKDMQQQQQDKIQKPASQFSRIYHEAHISKAGHPMCSLVLPPNYHTWEEYARIAQMVSFLPEKSARQAAADSPCGGAQKTMQQEMKQGGRPKNIIYGEDYDFEPHDLVALWCAAQRNTVALRHLIQLFSWVPEKEVNGNKRGQPKSGTPSSRGAAAAAAAAATRSEYVAVFRKNHKATKRRVLALFKRVNAIIEWAVMHQVFFTYHFMQQNLEKEQQGANQVVSPKKRSRNDSTSTLSKRPRTEHAPNHEKQTMDDYEHHILRACYRYLFRWFARRNQTALAILYFVDQDQFPPAGAHCLYYEEGGEALWERSKEANIPDAIRRHMNTPSADRSFARIDRRIGRGNFDEADRHMDPKETPFYLAVSGLLRVWKSCAATHLNIEPNSLDAVLVDFENIYDEFSQVRQREGVEAAAKSLLDLSAAEDPATEEGEGIDVPELLQQTPAPWNDCCAVCSRSRNNGPHESGELTVCFKCEKAYAQECFSESEFRTVQVGELLRQNDEVCMQHLFPVKIPDHGLIPDFRGENASEIQWTKETLTVRRRVLEDGKLQGFGLSVRQTEVSIDALDGIKEGHCELDKLYSECFDRDYPMATECEGGSLIIDIQEGSPCVGFRVCDVIIEVEFISFADNTKLPQMKYKLCDLDKEQRIELFRHPSVELKITVARPNVNLLDKCSEWIATLRRHNESAKLLFQHPLSICRFCQRDEKGSDRDGESENQCIRKDALNCRAVLRRLSMESYTRHFHDEQHKIGSGCTVTEESEHNSFHDRCISLRRLDAMMTWIIHVNSESHTDSSFLGSTGRLLRNAFFAEKERLSWAPPDLEKKPAQLLCCGIRLLLQQTFDGEEWEKSVMFQHFVFLFCAWCLATPVGPPPAASHSRPPWLKSSCCGCCARAGSVFFEGHFVCDSALCRRRVKTALHESQKDSHSLSTEENACDGKVVAYEDCARLVGTTVLLFPGDPILRYVVDEIGIKLQHFNRPVEFLVALYVPQYSRSAEKTEIKHYGDTFFLLPVLTETQLQYLLDRCYLLHPPVSMDPEKIHAWIAGSILGLRGKLLCFII
jgi:hypothetical protein